MLSPDFSITSTGITDIIESVAKCTTRVTERESLVRYTIV